MFLYECWKCPKNHRATARDAFSAFANGYARIGLNVAGKFFPLQTRGSVFLIRDLRARIAKR